MKCSSCGSTLKSIEYQARSADEAQRQIFRCVNCPLSIDDFAKQRSNVHVHLKRRERTLKPTPKIDSSVSCVVKYVRGKMPQSRCDSIDVDISSSQTIYATNYVDDTGKMFRYNHNGLWKGYGTHISSSKNICPNVDIIEMCILPIDTIHKSKYTLEKHLTHNGRDYTLSSKSICIWMEVVEDATVKDLVTNMYTTGFSPQSLADHMSQSTLGSLSNISARAYDKSSVKDYEHRFSTKPDGERLWMTRMGMAWLYSRRLVNHTVVGWQIQDYKTHVDNNSMGPIIDIECMIGFKSILIDVLMDSDGSMTKHGRSTNDIMVAFHKLQQEFDIVKGVKTRHFYDTLQGAISYRDSVQYPTDGIVAISNSNTDMFKIKSEKSIELSLNADGTLQTSDGNKLFSSDLHNTYSVSTIIEIRFNVHNGRVCINDMFHRPDKVKANDMNAVSSVIYSSIAAKDDSSNIVRTEIWRWSNTLRDTIYQIAQRSIRSRTVVMDIGTGSGQSIDSFNNMRDCSFILIEPDKDKCKKLVRRLGVRQFYQDPRSVIPVITQLKRGTTKYHVLNCSLQTIVNDKAIMQNITGVVSHCIACFSAHFVINELDLLSSKGFNIIGCCYMYDGIEVNSSIVDEYGLSMKRVNDKFAVVKWGTDTEYEEPSLIKEDIPQSLVSIRALGLVHNSSSDYKDVINRVCSHVSILRSR